MIPMFGRGSLTGFVNLTASGTITAATINATSTIDTPALTVDSINDSGAASITISETLTMAAGKHVDASAAGCLIKYDGANTTAPPIQAGNDSNTGIGSAAADTLVTWAGGVATIGTTATLVSVNVAGACTSSLDVTGQLNANGNVVTPKIYLSESSAPSGIADFAIFYAIDTAGKTDVLSMFQTGAGVKFVEEV